MQWVLLGVTLLASFGLIISCLPGYWPSWAHEWIDGHRKLAAGDVLAVELVRAPDDATEIGEPWRSRLVQAFNEAEFMAARRIALRGRAHLRIELRRGREIFVWCGRREHDIYLERRRRGRTRREYWAAQPELYEFLAHRPWLPKARLHAGRRPGERGARARKV